MLLVWVQPIYWMPAGTSLTHVEECCNAENGLIFATAKARGLMVAEHATIMYALTDCVMV
jgi:hypothetical protein